MRAQAQKRQLECVLQVLDSSGDSLRHAWPVVIGIIGDTLRLGGGTGGPSHPTVTANLIRIAFDSIKMVVTDFLPAIPLSVYPLLLDTIANFGTQNVDVNICLTAIGLLWNVSDYVSRHMAQMHTVPDDVVTSSLPTTRCGISPNVFMQCFCNTCLQCRTPCLRPLLCAWIVTSNGIVSRTNYVEVCILIAQFTVFAIPYARRRTRACFVCAFCRYGPSRVNRSLRIVCAGSYSLYARTLVFACVDAVVVMVEPPPSRTRRRTAE